MKHVHLVNPYQSVAMTRMLAPLFVYFPKLYVVSMGEAVDEKADLNIHMPYHTLAGRGYPGKHLIVYTHMNPQDKYALIDACEKADLVVCMSFAGRNELLNLGVRPEKIWVIYSAAEGFAFRKRNIGIVGFAQPSGRKRESLLLDLAWQYDLHIYNFVFAGDQWEGLVKQLNTLGVSAATVGAQKFDEIVDLYNKIDCLLVTGYAEGGPLPLLEAMSTGLPVISPRFGYASDLLDDKYLYDTVDECYQRLGDLFEDSMFHHLLTRAWTWEDAAVEYALIVGRLLNESVDLFPQKGMTRYSQLLDVIDEHKPSSICEVGTWNGHRAMQMIQQANKYKDCINYVGFDLFDEQTGRDVTRELSKYGWPEKVVERKLRATGAKVKLHIGNTKITLPREMPIADMYFIDGGHSEETIENDWLYCSVDANKNAVFVFDDYYYENKPDGMGCNKLINRLGDRYSVEFLPETTTDKNDGRKIGMVKVTRKDADIYLQMREQAHSRDTALDTNVSYSVVSNM